MSNEKKSMVHVVQKIVVMGAGSVGKSALVLRYTTDEYLEEHDPTIEDTYRKESEIDGQVVCLDILDTAGQEEFRSMQDGWIEQGEGFILVYDISQEVTFEDMQNFTNKIERANETKKRPFIIVGNKSDLEESRAVQRDAAQEFAKKHHATYIETSAKTSENVALAFETISKEIKNKNNAKAPKKKGFCTVL